MEIGAMSLQVKGHQGSHTRGWEEDSPQAPRGECSPADTQTADFLPLGRREGTSLLFRASWLVALCDVSPTEQIQ